MLARDDKQTYRVAQTSPPHLAHSSTRPRCSHVGVPTAAEATLDALRGVLRESAGPRLTAALRRADRPLRTMKRCEDKIRYRTAAGAKWALWGIWLDRYVRGRRRRRERRAYACPHCGGWHLTSQPKRRR
jgi:hypothetical protein